MVNVRSNCNWVKVAGRLYNMDCYSNVRVAVYDGKWAVRADPIGHSELLIAKVDGTEDEAKKLLDSIHYQLRGM